MKTELMPQTLAPLALLFITLIAHPSTVPAQSPEFTYQGRLATNGAPVEGAYDFEFRLFDAPAAGNQLSGPNDLADVIVAGGVFAVTLDFGDVAFDGSPRYLEIAVRPGASTNGYTALSPRQTITATPYAIQSARSASAGSAEFLSGTISAAQLIGTISSNNIGAGSITTVMLAARSVTSSQLADSAVTAGKLAADSVSSTVIQDGAVTPADLRRLTDFASVGVVTNPTPATGDNFGQMLCAIGTDKFAVGVPLDDQGGSGSGVVHVFNVNGTLLNTLTNPSPADNDNFGRAVAGLGDNRLVIGAPGDNTVLADSGIVYTYNLNGTRLHSITNPTPFNGDRFGEVITVVANNRIAVGVPGDGAGGAGDNSGVVHLFTTNGVFLLSITNPSPAGGDVFGNAVSAVGADKLVVGAATDDTFGFNAGIAYLFSTNGTLLTTFTNPAVGLFDTGNNQFGRSVAGVGGDKVLIGSPSFDGVSSALGIAYLFDTSGRLLQTIQPPWVSGLSQFGSALASVGADMMVVGGFNQIVPGLHTSGGALLLDLSGNILAELVPPAQASGDNFGYAVAGVGVSNVVVGSILRDTAASANGEVYVFNLEPYHAGIVAETVRRGGVTATALANGAVTASKLANEAVTAPALANGVVVRSLNALTEHVTLQAGADMLLTTNGNTLTIASVQAGNVWRLDGNAGTAAGTHFLGTSDNQPLELKVNGLRAFRLESGDNSSGIEGAPNVIGGSPVNYVAAGSPGSTIAGGGASTLNNSNVILSGFGVIGGGRKNVIGTGSSSATIAGGNAHYIENSALGGAIGGGLANSIGSNSSVSTISGGNVNKIGSGASFSSIGGGTGNGIDPGSEQSTIAGGGGNLIASNSPVSSIGGGLLNKVLGDSGYVTIGGGSNNLIASGSTLSTIAGGGRGFVGAGSAGSTISGGGGNHVDEGSGFATIAGGERNSIGQISDFCVVSGGANNTIGASSDSVVIGGGQNNTVSALAAFATIPGGLNNYAGERHSFAAGHRARAEHTGAFVWADAEDTNFTSTANNQFSIRARGGVRLSDNTPALSFGSTTRQMINLWTNKYGIGVQALTMYFRTDEGFSWHRRGEHDEAANTPGVGGTELMRLTAGGLTVNGSLVSSSDRHVKAGFTAVNSQEILAKVAALPIRRWHYTNDTATTHLGPVAQDFHAAFGVGPDDRHIATVDADGVALAAIQGLNHKLTEELKRRDAENADLKARLGVLEKMVANLTSTKTDQ